MAGIAHGAQLVDLGQHADAMDQRRQGRGAQGGLEATIDQRSIDRRRQLADQAVRGFSLGVVDDELQDDRRGHRQRDRLPVTKSEPGSPIAQCRLVAANRVVGFAFGQQGTHSVVGHFAKLLGVQRGDFRFGDCNGDQLGAWIPTR
jgi:hypothetical protein